MAILPEWKKIFANHLSDEGSITRIHTAPKVHNEKELYSKMGRRKVYDSVHQTFPEVNLEKEVQH